MLNPSALISDGPKMSQAPPSIPLALNGQCQHLQVCVCVCMCGEINMFKCVKEIHATGVESLQSTRQYSPKLILGKWKERHSSCHHPGLCTAIAEGAKQGIVCGPRPISRWFSSTKIQVCT